MCAAAALQPCKFSQENQKEVILNFDVNKTLIVEDTSKNMNAREMLVAILAESTEAVWQKGQPKMSFKDYVEKVAYPGDKSNPQLKAKRQEMISGFFTWMKDNGHEESFRWAQEQYKKVEKVFTDPKTGQLQFSVFPSFYRLLDHLKKQQWKFLVILRSFGKDLEKVAAEIQNHSPEIKFPKFIGEFQESGELRLGKETLSTVGAVYDRFRKSLQTGEHLAIRDCWKRWNERKEISAFGKLFPWKEGDSVKSFFFEDNVEGAEKPDEKDIVCPVEIEGRNQSVRALCGRMIFQVKTLDAILDPDYFIKLFEQGVLSIPFKAAI